MWYRNPAVIPSEGEESRSSRPRGPSLWMIAIPRLRRFAAPLGMTAVFASAAGAQKPERDYTVLVASEAVDLITRITFGPNGAKVEGTTKVGINPMDPDGPHGVGLTVAEAQELVGRDHGRTVLRRSAVEPRSRPVRAARRRRRRGSAVAGAS